MRVYYVADRYGRWFAGMRRGRMVFADSMEQAHGFRSGARAYEAQKRRKGAVLVSLLTDGESAKRRKEDEETVQGA